MSLSSDISTTSTALSDIKQAIIAKGVTPSGNITTYATAIGNIPQGSAVITSLSVTPTTSAQTITAPSGTDGYSPISVSAVTSAIDANITAQNIVSGVSILGVSGSATVLNGDTLSVTPTTTAQTINPTSPKNCFTKVKVAAVTSSIDSNLVAGNIRAGVTILGITGTYTGEASTITLTVIISNTEISGLDTFTIDGNSYTQRDFTQIPFSLDYELTLQLYADTNYDWSVTVEPNWTVISSASGKINSSVDTVLKLSFESEPD
jgi:hypothetical protein